MVKKLEDEKLMTSYLKKHQLQNVFPKEMESYLALYSYEQGELICHQGDSAGHLFILVKGKIKVYTTSVEGKTLILSFKTPLEVIGDIEYIQEIDIINTVEAVSSLTVIAVPYKWLKKYCENYPPFLRFLLGIITQKFYIKSDFLSFNLMHSVEVRLASYLLSHSFDEMHSLVTGVHTTESLKDAANLIGTSYRHLNRVLLQFNKKGLVERRSKSIVIKDWEGLKEIAGHSLYEKS
ncbi:Crp/Fnr family transcriptional regulator [Cytobacillus purgationiresistens]|uniref:CRP-like cAMP-binding protein n=1 Tax=Cytobacillus purgationiresistens TaxID=863449 RepID=A0ABU0AK57_9BACI|nr:Crp/Fnr family transcriptional regulator [Cytobacillus purgationiresistens]MDQ0271645.1 CRP-like cAMP-binding protein [Cytobacillus purgationiresistens]